MLMLYLKIGILFKVTKCRSFLLLTWFSISLLLSTLILSSFVVCEHEDGASVASSYQNSTIKIVSIEKAQNSKGAPIDDCSQSVCHFGHCPNLVLPLISGVNFSHSMEINYPTKFERPHSRFLDVPFQPPKLS